MMFMMFSMHNILEFTIIFVFLRQFLCVILKIKKVSVKGLGNALSYRDEITNLFVMIIPLHYFKGRHSGQMSGHNAITTCGKKFPQISHVVCFQC